MDPDKLPGIGIAALVIVGRHAVDKEAGAFLQLVDPVVVHQDAASGENQNDEIGFQVFAACHMAFLQLQVSGLLHIEEGGTGKGAGSLNSAAGAFHIRIRESVKIIIHKSISLL